MFYLILVFLTILFWPHEALAWGPATHLQLGWHVLHNLDLLIIPVRSLLELYPYDYLYGCISADIVVGKKFSRALNHCHNWRIGFKIMSRADSPFQKAFAYGYLSHLAADTVAHNQFVPDKMIATYSTRLLRHIYWEMRFDTHADRVVWDLPHEIMKDVHRENDPLLEDVLTGTILSFKTNKAIFNHLLLIHRMDQWHKMINRLSSHSKWVLDKKDVEEYYEKSFKAVVDVLSNHKKAVCIKEDPAGRRSLARAKVVRRKLKLMTMIGLPINIPAIDAKDVLHSAEKIRQDRN